MRENKLKRFIPRNLEQDAVEQDEEEAHPIAIVNRIRWADQMEEQAQVTEYEDESRWVYCRRTHKWINTEDIRFLGPVFFPPGFLGTKSFVKFCTTKK
jgi:hypothetical protein